MRYIYSFAVSAVLVFLCFPVSAAVCVPGPSAVCKGLPCSSLGETKMDGNKKNIIACLEEDTSTTLIWKAFTAGTAPAGTTPPVIPGTVDPNAGHYCPWGFSLPNCPSTCIRQVLPAGGTCQSGYMEPINGVQVAVCKTFACNL